MKRRWKVLHFTLNFIRDINNGMNYSFVPRGEMNVSGPVTIGSYSSNNTNHDLYFLNTGRSGWPSYGETST